MKIRDLTGQQFGRLKVLERAEDYISPSGNHAVQWKCECQCENKTIVIVQRSSLTNHTAQSCGCLQKELLSKRKSKQNRYDLSGEYGIGWTSNTDEEFYFDLEDYEKIKDYCWSKNIDDKNYVSLRARNKGTKKIVLFHQIIAGGINKDHINRNPLDNRKNNLRDATVSENAKNKSKRNDNTSGVTGVSYEAKSGTWRAEITCNKQKFYLGSFADKNRAITERLRAEQKYFGEFAPQKHLYSQYLKE